MASAEHRRLIRDFSRHRLDGRGKVLDVAIDGADCRPAVPRPRYQALRRGRRWQREAVSGDFGLLEDSLRLTA